MSKLWIALGAALVLLVGGAFFLSSQLNGYLDENRGWIAEQAEAAIGRKVAFGGLGVSFSGGLGVSVSQLSIAEDPAFGDGQFLALEEAVVRVKIWPALFGRYEVSSVMLREPRITVIQGRKGLSTDSLGGAASDTAPAEAEPAAAFAIALMDIEDGELTYIDRSGAKPVTLTIQALDVEASDLGMDEPIDFTLSARVLGADAQNLRASGRVGPLSSPGAVPADLELSLSPLPIDDLLRLPQMKDALPAGGRAAGELALDVEAKGNAERVDWTARFDAGDAEIVLPETFTKARGVALGYEASGVYSGDAVEIAAGTLTLGRAALETKGRITLGDSTTYRFDVASKGVPLAGWEKILPATDGLGLDGAAAVDVAVQGNTASSAGPRATGTITLKELAARIPGQPDVEGMNSVLTLREGGMVMPETSFRYGKSEASISGRIADLMDPKMTFVFRSPAMLGESLGLNEPGAKNPDVLKELRLEGTIVPTETGSLLESSITSASGVLSGIPYEKLTGRIATDENEARAKNLVMNAFGGQVKVDATYDLSLTDRPAWDVNLQLSSLDAARVAASQFGFGEGLLTGKINSTMALRGRGFEWEMLVEALTGQGEIDISEGMLQNVNLGEAVLQKFTGVQGLSNLLSPDVKTKHPRLFAEGGTAFRELRSKLEVRDGRVLAKNLDLDAPDFGLSGDGSIGLNGDLQLNTTFRTSPELARSLTGQGGVARYLAGSDGRIAIPVAIGGSMSGVSVKPDLGFVKQALAQSAKDTVRKEAVGLLSNVLGGRPAAPAPADPAAQPADPAAAPAEPGTTPAPAPAEEQKPESARDVLEKGLGGLLGR